LSFLYIKKAKHYILKKRERNPEEHCS